METPQPPPIGSIATRPALITVLCVIMLIGVVISIPLIFSSTARHVGPWYSPYLAFGSLVSYFCTVGLWKMRRWAVYTYTGLVVLNQIVMMVMGAWNIIALVIPGIFIGLMFSQVAKMK
jgi:hypothetical protein